jgi:hypothetical protein
MQEVAGEEDEVVDKLVLLVPEYSCGDSFSVLLHKEPKFKVNMSDYI